MPWRYCKGQNGGLGYYNTITLEIRDTKPDDFELDTLTWTQGTHLKLHSEKDEELLGKAMRGETKKRDAEIERKVSRARARIEEAQKSTWVATYDPESEQYYYYCSHTHETVWEKPDNYIMAADDETMYAVIKIQTMWRAHLARQQTRLLALKGQLNADDALIRESVAKAKEKQDEMREKALRRAKKRGFSEWVECYDPAKDAFYYTRKFTDKLGQEQWEVVWEKPNHYVMAADDQTMAAAIKVQCLWRKKVATRKLKAALDQKKRQEMDPHLKEAVQACIEEAEAAIAKIEAEGGERWIEHFDEKTQRYFFEGEMSEDRTWSQPKDYVMVADEPTVAATIQLQLQWRGKMCRDRLQSALNSKNRGLTRKEKERVDATMAAIALEIERITLVHGCHWVEVYDPEKEDYYFQDLISGRKNETQPKHYVMSCEVDVLISVIRVQCAWRCKMARRRCALQVSLLESRASDFRDPFDLINPEFKENPKYDQQTFFVDDENFDPRPLVAAPPGMPGVPEANGAGPSQVHLRWSQPESSVPITFCTIKIRPVMPTKGDRDREVEVETPAQIGWAETTVDDLLEGRSYTFQVKARNLEGYGEYSNPSDIAVPLDPNRFHFPLEIHVGSRLRSVCLGEVKVAKETTLEEARHIIFDSMGAVRDGIRHDLSGKEYLSQEPMQARWPVELVAKHSYAFARGDCDRRMVSVPRHEERTLRALDFQPKGTPMLDEDKDGTFDFNQKLYLQPLQIPAQHNLPNVKNVEIHVRRPVFVVDNVSISDEGEAKMAAKPGKQPTLEGLQHPWDDNHVVIGVQTVDST